MKVETLIGQLIIDRSTIVRVVMPDEATIPDLTIEALDSYSPLANDLAYHVLRDLEGLRLF